MGAGRQAGSCDSIPARDVDLEIPSRRTEQTEVEGKSRGQVTVTETKVESERHTR